MSFLNISRLNDLLGEMGVNKRKRLERIFFFLEKEYGLYNMIHQCKLTFNREHSELWHKRLSKKKKVIS